MPKNSRQQIPSKVADLKNEKIPQTVATSVTLDDYENKNITFSFESYNSNQCEIAKVSKSEARKLTKELKKMSMTLTKHFLSQSSSGIACKQINNSGNYSVLFNEIPEDTELLEVDYSGAGRVFGYLVHNIFNVVVIDKRHR